MRWGTLRLGAQQPPLPVNADSAGIDRIAVDSATASTLSFSIVAPAESTVMS